MYNMARKINLTPTLSGIDAELFIERLNSPSTPEEIESLKNKITEWVEFYKITDIKFACDVETFNDFIQYVNDKKHQDDIKKEYDTSYSLNEKCQELLENAVTLYQHYNTHLELKYNNNEILAISLLKNNYIISLTDWNA